MDLVRARSAAVTSPGKYRRAVQCYLCQHVSIWEVVDKAAKFRLPIAGSSVDKIVARIDELQTILVPIQLEVVVASVKLPQVHGDPMDRVLIAQAQRLNATLISKDGKFAQYDVPLLWK